MAIDWAAVKVAIFAWFEAGSGLANDRIVWTYQKGTRPPTPFADINPRFAVARLGAYDEARLDPNTPGQIERVRQRRLTISCNAYGPGAFDLMERAQEYLDSEAGRAALAPAGLVVADYGKVTDLTKLLETDYEERAHLDVTFSLAVTDTEDVGWIQTSQVTSTFKNPNGTTADTSTLTIPGS